MITAEVTITLTVDCSETTPDTAIAAVKAQLAHGTFLDAMSESGVDVLRCDAELVSVRSSK